MISYYYFESVHYQASILGGRSVNYGGIVEADHKDIAHDKITDKYGAVEYYHELYPMTEKEADSYIKRFPGCDHILK